MTNFDREMQRALMLDAQKLRDEGVDCDDPIFLDDDGEAQQRASIETRLSRIERRLRRVRRLVKERPDADVTQQALLAFDRRSPDDIAWLCRTLRSITASHEG